MSCARLTIMIARRCDSTTLLYVVTHLPQLLGHVRVHQPQEVKGMQAVAEAVQPGDRGGVPRRVVDAAQLAERGVLLDDVDLRRGKSLS